MKKYSFFVFNILLFFACDKNEGLINDSNFNLQIGSGSFTFDQYQPFNNKPIEVYYHIPENANPSSPVLISLHGMNRNGENHRNSLINKSNQYRFVLVVPEFSENYFSGGDGYNLANIFIDGDNPSAETLNPNEDWTFSVLDPLFIYFKNLVTNYSNNYNLIGFSAGGQLAHRAFIFNNSIYCHQTISMSSGWYTTIDENQNFPYGLNESPFNNNTASLFSRNLTILIGQNDNDPNAPNLRRNSIVDLQGNNRFDRAEYFYTSAENLANEKNYIFNWQKFIVPNVAHDLSPIANFAVDLLYQ